MLEFISNLFYKPAALAVVLISVPTNAVAQTAFGWLPGYLESSKGERDRVLREIQLPESMPPEFGEVLTDIIFDEKISREFRRQYDNTFGGSAAEKQVFSITQYQYTTNAESQIIDFETANRQNQRFAEFMIRRLAEYHVDKFVRSKPSLKRAYELKEQLSNLNVQVNEKTRFDINYSFGGQILTSSLSTPWIDARHVIDFAPDPIQTGNQSVESRLFLIKEINTVTEYEASYSFTLNSTSLTWRRMWPSDWQTSLLLSVGPTPEFAVEWETRMIAGLSLRY